MIDESLFSFRVAGWRVTGWKQFRPATRRLVTHFDNPTILGATVTIVESGAETSSNNEGRYSQTTTTVGLVTVRAVLGALTGQVQVTIPEDAEDTTIEVGDIVMVWAGIDDCWLMNSIRDKELLWTTWINENGDLTWMFTETRKTKILQETILFGVVSWNWGTGSFRCNQVSAHFVMEFIKSAKTQWKPL